MAIIVARSNLTTTGDEASPRLGAHTLGLIELVVIVCLFSIVLAYQLLPRKKKPMPGLKPLTNPNQQPPSFLHIDSPRSRCTTFFNQLKRKFFKRPSPQMVEEKSARRSLRALHLRPNIEIRKVNSERTRSMFGNTPRLKLSIPDMRNPFTAPLVPKRKHYSHLVDPDETDTHHLKVPDPAFLSPWSSPGDREFPQSPDTPVSPLVRPEDEDMLLTPPPVELPPRVYVPETPMRRDFVPSMEEEWEKLGVDPFRDAKTSAESEKVLRSLKKRQKELEEELRKEGVFIISDAGEWDLASDSDSDSLYSSQPP